MLPRAEELNKLITINTCKESLLTLCCMIYSFRRFLRNSLR